MDVFMKWIKQIIYLLIFLTLLMELLPQKSYGKYVRFFAGLVFVAALIAPPASLLTGGDWQDRLEQSVQEEIQAFLEAGGTDDADLDAMEEARERVYTDFASGYTDGEE